MNNIIKNMDNFETVRICFFQSDHVQTLARWQCRAKACEQCLVCQHALWTWRWGPSLTKTVQLSSCVITAFSSLISTLWMEYVIPMFFLSIPNASFRRQVSPERCEPRRLHARNHRHGMSVMALVGALWLPCILCIPFLTTCPIRVSKCCPLKTFQLPTARTNCQLLEGKRKQLGFDHCEVGFLLQMESQPWFRKCCEATRGAVLWPNFGKILFNPIKFGKNCILLFFCPMELWGLYI